MCLNLLFCAILNDLIDSLLLIRNTVLVSFGEVGTSSNLVHEIG